MSAPRRAAAPLARERLVILGLLLVLAAAAWVVVLREAEAGDGMSGMSGLTMGMQGGLFLAIWVAMMVAMMFPAAAPMILTFAMVHADRRRQGGAFVPTWVFVGAYLAVWALFGVLAYGLARGAESLAAQSMWLMDHAAQIGGVLLIVAGLYQLSPLKHACLAHCRTPLQFIMSSWREGYGGALRMGIEHGAYCVGCCWLLFVILFPLGVMNVAAMALLTLLIFAEKVLPLDRLFVWGAGLVLIVYGALVVAMPSLLPMAM